MYSLKTFTFNIDFETHQRLKILISLDFSKPTLNSVKSVHAVFRSQTIGRFGRAADDRIICYNTAIIVS